MTEKMEQKVKVDQHSICRDADSFDAAPFSRQQTGPKARLRSQAVAND